ncbi:3alpha(or 20beta)-hydroxysteroid dehydrogenase [Sphingobium wenxiniae]|uniref:3-alpha-hydroxysteroid dehydrogenase n=2 Tax=Sphingobium TaxID=165695 RepID=T0GGL3_9SPHN|nr:MULTISPECIES: glucose 1-dehydrogenase [Sphingobium]EQA99212.1 hypothetical protein L485_16830 [Sphingobium baderi LL03]KMS61358.1 3-alpha-hydroxysteroid dehydrogenase [Sphingobium baderi LL03]MBB6191021.1 3alpha(or 20beta)-hydroxysteroid dehydrogenase [Sphingobium wenxiniae]TWH93673.1 3alpha(or 20beta)-hydroxysteroid dehydrogenase [Sphingobium wenxiniae]
MAIEEAQAPARGHDRLAGKIAIVTGAARGIGEAVARRFVAEGARVVMADISDSGADLAASLGSAAFFVKADATSGADWERLVGLAGEQFGGIDILVNNAGAGAGVGQLIDESEDRHRHVVELNLTSAWLGIRHVAPVMARRGGGAIVNISSMDGLVGIAGMASYSAAKFGVTGLTRSFALEAGAMGIRVNSVHPGFIGTPLVLGSGDAVRARLDKAMKGQPIPRLGRPDEVAAAVLFFASDEASYCTGASLVVDGGHIAGPTREPLDP